MRMSDLLSHPGSLVPEDQVWTTCPVCLDTQWLNTVVVEEEPTRTVYRCARGCGPILTLAFGPSDRRAGHVMRDWVVNNPTDLFCRPVTGDGESIRFAAT
jgi:hypothetical protein